MYQGIKKKSIATIIALGIVASIMSAIAAATLVFMPIISIVTSLVGLLCIIYPIVILSKMVNEINIMCADDQEHLMHYVLAMLLGWVTLGIYDIYYYYRIQNRLHMSQYKYGVKVVETGNSVILWCIIGIFTLGIGNLVAQAIILRNFNKLAASYNNMKGLGTESEEQGLAKKMELKCTVSCVQGVHGEPLIGGSVELGAGQSVIIGRDPNVAQLVVKDTQVSRNHCLIKMDGLGNKILITDFSSNGTRVDNQMLVKGIETQINRGTTIILSANTKFTVK